MENLLLLSLILGYFIGAFLTIRFASRRLAGKNIHVKLLSLAFLNALFFGLGIVGSGGDPGIALPTPNLIAIIFTFAFDWTYIDIVILIVMLVFWWMLIYAVLCFAYELKVFPRSPHT